MSRSHKTVRRTFRRLNVRAGRPLDRPHLRHLPGHRRQPSDLAQALTAFARVIRCHRRLAKLAPSFFDSAVVDRETRERQERRRWMESWEPVIEKVYGPKSTWEKQPAPMAELPPLPDRRTQRAVERHLADWKLWVAAGRLALARHQRLRPHALPTFGQLVRMLEIGIDFGRLACGLDTSQPEPALSSDVPSFEEALARAYGHR